MSGREFTSIASAKLMTMGVIKAAAALLDKTLGVKEENIYCIFREAPARNYFSLFSPHL